MGRKKNKSRPNKTQKVMGENKAKVENQNHSHPHHSAQVKHPRWVSFVGMGSAMLAVCLSIYLLILHISGSSAAGCGPESSCGDVLTSRWSRIGVVPVSLFGLPIYLGLVLGYAGHLKRRTDWQWVANSAALLVIASSLYFSAIQYFIIQEICPYCLATHVFASVASIMVWKKPKTIPKLGSAINLYTIVMLVWISGVGLQVLMMGGTDENKEVAIASSETLTSLAEDEVSTQKERSGPRVAQSFGLDTEYLPIIGSANAENFAIALIDYTCKYCRNLHKELETVAASYPNQIAFILAPMPLDSECNTAMARRNFETSRSHVEGCEFARLALGLHKTDPLAYLKWDSEMMHRSKFPTFLEALTYARSLVDQGELGQNIVSEWVQQQIYMSSLIYDNHYSVYNQGNMPQMIINGQPQFTPFNGATDIISRLKLAYPGQFP